MKPWQKCEAIHFFFFLFRVDSLVLDGGLCRNYIFVVTKTKYSPNLIYREAHFIIVLYTHLDLFSNQHYIPSTCRNKQFAMNKQSNKQFNPWLQKTHDFDTQGHSRCLMERHFELRWLPARWRIIPSMLSWRNLHTIKDFIKASLALKTNSCANGRISRHPQILQIPGEDRRLEPFKPEIWGDVWEVQTPTHKVFGCIANSLGWWLGDYGPFLFKALFSGASC